MFSRQFLKALRAIEPELAKKVDQAAPWQKYFSSLRDPVAHRIPLYAPPALLTKEDSRLYSETDDAAKEAFSRQDFGRANELITKLDRIGLYVPYLAHDWHSEGGHRAMYPQILDDLTQMLELIDAVSLVLKRIADQAPAADLQNDPA